MRRTIRVAEKAFSDEGEPINLHRWQLQEEASFDPPTCGGIYFDNCAKMARLQWCIFCAAGQPRPGTQSRAHTPERQTFGWQQRR
jgi:hypothetical protein